MLAASGNPLAQIGHRPCLSPAAALRWHGATRDAARRAGRIVPAAFEAVRPTVHAADLLTRRGAPRRGAPAPAHASASHQTGAVPGPAAPATNPSDTPQLVAALTDELRLLTTERDEALRAAEQYARTSVKLDEMATMLDRMALEKVKDGDEGAARAALKEKATTADVLARTNERAQANYLLASKLAEKIGAVQRRLVDLLSPGRAPAPAPAAAAAGRAGGAAEPGTAAFAAAPAQPAPREAPPAVGSSGGGGAGGATATRGAGFVSSSTPASSGAAPGAAGAAPDGAGAAPDGAGYAYTPRKPAWEDNLETARLRIAGAQAAAAGAGAAAAAAGNAASWRGRESIEEARERLRREAAGSVASAQARVRSKARESIAEARERIAAEDAAVLAQVQELMSQYRRGQYVSEEALEWAFQQLERRFMI